MITPTSILPAAASASTPTTSPTSSGLPTSQGLDTMFLQLLVAQLQNQDPTSPLDPSQFVGQLAQFSELSEVTQIDQIMQQYAGAGSGSGTTGSGSTGGSAPNPGGTPTPANPLSSATASPILSSAVSAARAALSNFSSPSPSVLSQIQGVF